MITGSEARTRASASPGRYTRRPGHMIISITGGYIAGKLLTIRKDFPRLHASILPVLINHASGQKASPVIQEFYLFGARHYVLYPGTRCSGDFLLLF
jgi:hypothetical protein